ncbi:DNA repair protein SWI5 homolog [Lytechinus variegatus]|uniref:DNA repair protein SWI5 homolog n=1 Tax=Lytechinus variegatus TaxID=7654 RepID=UPI001BB2A8E2|nr:DNA repair protein SWI5 homolog [Lytechinus variegatus]
MDHADPKEEIEDIGSGKPIKRRRLGRSLGTRNSSWVPPFATPPSAQKSGGRSSGNAADQSACPTATSAEFENSATTSFCESTPNRKSEKLTSVNITPRSSLPRMLGSLSSRKRSRGDFKSPMRNVDEKKQAETPESIEKENDRLRERLLELDKEISELKDEGLSEDELQLHIKKIHEYNELKDMTQMLLGRIAMLEGVTTRELHEEMGLGED